MRDLGLMGESTFSLLCAEVGLIPNGSQIDKTGWDFFVEFPFDSGLSPQEIHKSAYECKVQVKATDKSDRKLSITLSNLRRLITAQMPAFFIFIEFDGKSSAQRAFVVHVDNNLITKVLKRLHQIEQSDQENKFHKRTMTIHYDNTNRLDKLNGDCLKNCFLSYIGNNIAEYIANKKSYLESTGYEDGFAQLTFSTEGEENLNALIDMSLGIKNEVEVSKLKSVVTRFGISSTHNSLPDADSGKISMPDIKPNAEGKIRFREDKFSAKLSFDVKLYISALNAVLPDKLKKMRIEGEFFDLKFNPYTGAANYLFSFGEGIRLEVRKFRDAIRLLNLLGSSGKKVFAELIFDGFPRMELAAGAKEQKFNFSNELKALDCAIKLITEFDMTDFIDISFDEISKYGTYICQMHHALNSAPNSFKIEFGIEGSGYDSEKETACVFLITTAIGSHTFGTVFVLIGHVESIDDERYRLIPNDMVIEKRMISERDESIPDEDLNFLIEEIEHKYEGEYSVVSMFDKKC